MNEKFEMKTQMDYDPDNKVFIPKPTELEVWQGKKERRLGVTPFDLARYAGKPKTEEQIPLQECEDPNAYVTVLIRTKEVMETPSART